MRGELSCKGVDALDEGSDSKRLPASANVILCRGNEVGDVRVRKSHLLCSVHELPVNVFQGTGVLESQASLYDIVDLVQEPLKSYVNQTVGPNRAQMHLIDLGQLVDLINRVALVVHRVSDDK